MDVTLREEQVLTADDTVNSLGLVFVALPPLPPPPMIVKHVHQGTWADTAGIGPGCEVLELGGLKVGSMTREEFTKAIKSRPLRIRLQPPNSNAWKQVAHFQKETVRLQLKKVLLQKALRDEHDKVKAELGVDLQAEEERKAKNKESRQEIALQRSRLEEQKRQLLEGEAQLESRREQLEQFDQETQSRRKKLEVEKLQLEKQQGELERARLDFQGTRKTNLEAIEKEKQALELERKRLVTQQDETSLAEQEREDMQLLQTRYAEQQQELLTQRADFEVAVEHFRGEVLALEQQRAGLQREREDLEEDLEGMSRARGELMEQKAKVASLEEEVAAQRAELERRRREDQERLEEQKQLLASSQVMVAKEKADFSEKCKKVQQQLLTQKRQLLQAKRRGEGVEAASQTELASKSQAVQTELAAKSQALQTEQLAAVEASVQTGEEESENTDAPEEAQVRQLQSMAHELQTLLAEPGDVRHALSETLERMLGVLSPDAKKTKKEPSRPLRRLSPDGPQSQQLARKAMAQTVVVRKLLAHELKREPQAEQTRRPKSLPRRGPSGAERVPSRWGLK